MDQLKALVMSLHEHAPDERVVANLLDFEKLPTDLCYINPNVSIHYRDAGTDKISKKDITGFMWCYRSIVMRDMLKNHDEPILYLDTDILVRGSLDQFWEDIKPNSIKVMKRNTKEDISKFQAGVFAVGSSEETRAMMEHYNKVVQGNIYPFAEQEHLYKSWIKFKDIVTQVQLDECYNDWHFDSKSTIWHCKGKHFKEKRYQDEYQGYLSRANAKLPRHHPQ